MSKVHKKREWLGSARSRQAGRRTTPIAVRLAKQAILTAEETSLSAGLETERRLYELSMATEDRVEDAGVPEARAEVLGK